MRWPPTAGERRLRTFVGSPLYSVVKVLNQRRDDGPRTWVRTTSSCKSVRGLARRADERAQTRILEPLRDAGKRPESPRQGSLSLAYRAGKEFPPPVPESPPLVTRDANSLPPEG